MKIPGLFSFCWYNWRTFYDLPFGGFLYMLPFAAITWAIIQGMDKIYQSLRPKRKKR